MMKQWVSGFCVLMAVLSLAPLPLGAAGFDCTLDTLNPTEKAICENPNLSHLDDAATVFYADHKKSLMVVFEDDEARIRERSVKNQRAWNAERDQCGADVECIEGQYFDYLGSNDLAFINAKMARMQALPDDQYVMDYDRIIVSEGRENEVVYEAVLRAQNTNRVEFYAQGDFSHNNVQWLDFYTNGTLNQTEQSGETGFFVSNIAFYLTLPFETVKLVAEAGDLILRGNMTYTLAVHYGDNLTLETIETQGVSRPGIGDTYRNIRNYQTKSFSGAVGVFSSDCALYELPQLFAYEAGPLFPEWPTSPEDRPDYSYDRMEAGSPDPSTDQDLRYQLAVMNATDAPEESMATFKALQSEGYPLPAGTVECMGEIIEHFKDS